MRRYGWFDSAAIAALVCAVGGLEAESRLRAISCQEPETPTHGRTVKLAARLLPLVEDILHGES